MQIQNSLKYTIKHDRHYWHKLVKLYLHQNNKSPQITDVKSTKITVRFFRFTFPYLTFKNMKPTCNLNMFQTFKAK